MEEFRAVKSNTFADIIDIGTTSAHSTVPVKKERNIYIKKHLSVRLGIEGMLVRDSPLAQSILCP